MNEIQKFKEIWEPKKEYIEKDLWVIRNFLTEEELEWLIKEANDPNDWYSTMRSPYGKNTKNKFLNYITQYDENGEVIPPHPSNNPKFNHSPLMDAISMRCEAVLPKYFAGIAALQSFFEVPDEQIIKELGHNVDYAMDFHYERDDEDDDEDQRLIIEKEDGSKIFSQSKITAAFNVYINDNFDGGILEFKNKDYAIKPEPGMLINIPLYKEFEHRVTKVTNGNRHALYGRSWSFLKGRHLSSKEDC